MSSCINCPKKMISWNKCLKGDNSNTKIEHAESWTILYYYILDFISAPKTKSVGY
jgi:hypothetical protein